MMESWLVRLTDNQEVHGLNPSNLFRFIILCNCWQQKNSGKVLKKIKITVNISIGQYLFKMMLQVYLTRSGFIGFAVT